MALIRPLEELNTRSLDIKEAKVLIIRRVESIYRKICQATQVIGEGAPVEGLDVLKKDVYDLIPIASNKGLNTEKSLLYLIKDELSFLEKEIKRRKGWEFKEYSEKTLEILSGNGFVYRNMGDEELALLLKGETINSNGDFSKAKSGTPSEHICFFHEYDWKNAESWMEKNTVKFKVTDKSKLKKSWGVYPDWDVVDGEKILTEFYCKNYNNKLFEIVDIVDVFG